MPLSSGYDPGRFDDGTQIIQRMRFLPYEDVLAAHSALMICNGSNPSLPRG
uniref:Uncharacterized protein n=1 Tax=Candidatus Nitrotoga fabula TaxID=2182327 RepID=A0A2X0QUF2_9PROT|nr:protein of unknown function [Candidatus Nitrotoga fabula]